MAGRQGCCAAEHGSANWMARPGAALTRTIHGTSQSQATALMASNSNRVFTRDQLLDKVWGFDYLGDSRTVDVHVKRLREKLEGVSEKWTLKTVWGVGYKFELLN